MDDTDIKCLVWAFISFLFLCGCAALWTGNSAIAAIFFVVAGWTALIWFIIMPRWAKRQEIASQRWIDDQLGEGW